MKRILLPILLFLGALVIPFKVDAASFSTGFNGPSNVDVGKQFTVTVYASGVTDLFALEGTLNYDRSKLQLVSNSGLNGYTVIVGSRLTADTLNPKSGTVEVATLVFQPTSSFASGTSTEISYSGVSGVMGSTGDGDVSGNGGSITVTMNFPKSGNADLAGLTVNGSSVSNFQSSNTQYNLGQIDKEQITIAASASDGKATISGTGTKNLKYGKNTFPIVVTAENGTSKTYTIVVNRPDPRSSNNYLKELKVSEGKLDFDKKTLEYTLTVDNKITSIDVSGSVEDSKAKVDGFKSYELEEGVNQIKIVVTAENGSNKTYTINVTRTPSKGNTSISSDNTLESVIVNGVSLNLIDGKFVYLVTVPNTANELDLEIVTKDENAIVNYDENKSLEVGANTVTFTVTASNGESVSYTLYVVRRDNLKYYKVDGAITGDMYHLMLTNSIISPKILEELNKTTKEIYLEKIDDEENALYQVKINGNLIKGDLDSLIKLIETDTGIEELTKGNNISFRLGAGNNATYRAYVGEKYTNNQSLILYSYKDGKIEKVRELKVIDGHISFDGLEDGIYIISDKSVKQPIDIKSILIVVEAIFIVCELIIFYIVLRKGRKKHKKVV